MDARFDDDNNRLGMQEVVDKQEVPDVQAVAEKTKIDKMQGIPSPHNQIYQQNQKQD